MSTPKTPHDCIRNAEAAIANFATQLSEEALRDIAAVVAMAKSEAFTISLCTLSRATRISEKVADNLGAQAMELDAKCRAALSACGVEVNSEG